MASLPATKPSAAECGVTKLPRLPKNARVRKRPILHPQVPSRFTAADQQKVVYISARTPFVSAVKRVRKLLAQIDKRSMGGFDLVNSKNSEKENLRRLGHKANGPTGKATEEVVLKATNKAIENVLGLALFFQGQEDCNVQLRTGTVGVVDDIVGSTDAVPGQVAEGDEEELPESRIRKASVMEVSINLK